MADILRLAAVFAAIVALLRAKVRVGIVLAIAALTLALLYLMPPRDIYRTIIEAAVDPVTIKLLTALTLIRMLEMVLRERQILTRMMQAFRSLVPSRKASIISMPLLIGMLPSVGGAYFSAPMVDEATRDIERMSREEKGFINYWFRHPWEMTLPLYPGILLASAISGMPLRTLVLYNLAGAGMMLATGFMFSMRDIAPLERSGAPDDPGLASFIPLASVLVLVMAMDVQLWAALLIVIAGLCLYYKYGLSDIRKVIGYGITGEVVLLILGVMLFKTAMEHSGAVGGVSAYFKESGMPLAPMLVLLPFGIGLLTGLTVGFVGATFPLLVSLPGGDTPAAISLAFTAGFAGVLISPVHVCLVLTREYFDAEMSGIYKRMAVPVALVALAAAAVYCIVPSAR